jgi:hypothetical protein
VSGRRRAPLRLGVVALLLLGRPGALHAADLAGWDETRWGMRSPEIAKLYGNRATHLSGRIEFYHLYADTVLKGASFAGLAFTVYFQMDEGSGRLAQVLLERRRQYATPEAWHAVLQSLEDAYGQATASCARGVERSPAHVGLSEPERVWVLPSTTIHASYIDVAVSSFDANVDTVRRLLVRYAPTEPGRPACS